MLDQLVRQLVAKLDRFSTEDLLDDVLQHPVAGDDLLVIRVGGIGTPLARILPIVSMHFIN